MPKVKGNLKVHGFIDVKGHRVRQVGAPVDPNDAIRLQDVPGYSALLPVDVSLGAVTDIVTIPSTKGVVEISVSVGSVAFDGGAELSIGTSGNPSLVMAIKEIDLSKGGIYFSNPFFVFDSDTIIKAFFDKKGATTGGANIKLVFA